jgi:mannose-6-phosphate isomerase-like protein (cupin superfamily)
MPLVQGLPDSFFAWGLARHPAGAINPVEPHYHDCDEWYFLIEGSMRVRSEGIEYAMRAGDVLWTPMGEEHEILAVDSDVTMFWLEGPLRGAKRPGHLHRT